MLHANEKNYILSIVLVTLIIVRYDENTQLSRKL
jgi:hypothetical protein